MVVEQSNFGGKPKQVLPESQEERPIQAMDDVQAITPRNLHAKVELPLPSSKVPTQDRFESGQKLEGNQLWRYLKNRKKNIDLGRVATDIDYTGNDWIAFLEEDGHVRAVQIYSAVNYDADFINKIVGFGETSKYSSNTGLLTADALCKKLEDKKIIE